MKSKVSTPGSSDRLPYPKLISIGRPGDPVYLADKGGDHLLKGVIVGHVDSPDGTSLGKSFALSEYCYTDFTGTITLEND